MPAFGALAPFGLIQFGATPTVAESIYVSLRAGVAEAFTRADEDDHTAGTNYARALALASAHATIRHGFGQRRPRRTVEFLPALERLYGLSPMPSESEEERRRVVASRKLISRGSRRESIEAALTTLLGAAFIGLRTEPQGTTPGLFPASPATAGAWDAPNGLARFYKLNDAISLPSGTAQTFGYTNILGDGARILPGDILSLEPENIVSAQAITILSASTSGPTTASAIITKSHDAGAILRSHAPVWISMRRSMIVVVTPAAAQSRVTRSKIDALMRRLVRGTTIWSIASGLGPFTVGSSQIGMVPIGVITI